jgi:hypothetical protein
MRLGNALTMLGLAAFVGAAPLLDGEKRDAAALVQKLGDKDYKTRKEAFHALEQMGGKARAELEKASKSDDPETRWSATLLLDRLNDPDAEAPSSGLRERRARDGDPLDEIRDSLRRLESRDGRDPFGSGFFHDPFDDDFFRRFDDLSRTRDSGGEEVQMGPGSSMSRVTDHDGQRESVTVKVDPSGHATADVEKNGEKTKYEADSFDQLKKEHPELFQGMFGGMSVRVRPFGRGPNLAPAPRDSARNGLERPRDLAPKGEPRDADDTSAAPADRPRLGVQVRALSPDVADFLELDDGVGLEVVRVVDGSAAAQLGVQKHDVIVRVNGREIRSDRDVAKALEGKDPAQAEVVVVRREAERTLGKKQ